MLSRLAPAAAALALHAVLATVVLATAPAIAQPTPADEGPGAEALADPAPPQGATPAGEALPPDPSVPSGAASSLETPDGWELRVGAKDETQEAVAPLTTALSSREYLVGGTFTGLVTGGGTTELTGGSLEAGYRIGCGIVGGPVEMIGEVGTETVINPLLQGFSVAGEIKINLRPGIVEVLPVGQKNFTGDEVRITITGLRVKVDNCVGESFLQSYATLTSSTADTDDVVTYVGEIKAV